MYPINDRGWGGFELYANYERYRNNRVEQPPPAPEMQTEPLGFEQQDSLIEQE